MLGMPSIVLQKQASRLHQHHLSISQVMMKSTSLASMHGLRMQLSCCSCHNSQGFVQVRAMLRRHGLSPENISEVRGKILSLQMLWDACHPSLVRTCLAL